DRRFLVLVDGDDGLRILHAGEVLDRARDADRDIDLRGDDLAGLADLIVVGDIARVHRRAARADARAELVGERFDDRVEILAVLERAAARDDDLGRGQLGPLGFGDFRADEARQPGIALARDRLDRSRAAFARRLLERGAAHGDDLLGVGRLHLGDRV